MKRNVRLRRTPLKASAARLKRSRLKPLSARRRRLLPERTALLLGLKELVGWRCEFCRSERPLTWTLDGHEVRKPRSKYWLNPEYVVILCRPHHEMAEASYKAGRLEIPGTRSTGWQFSVVYAASKFAGRKSNAAL